MNDQVWKLKILSFMHVDLDLHPTWSSFPSKYSTIKHHDQRSKERAAEALTNLFTTEPQPRKEQDTKSQSQRSQLPKQPMRIPVSSHYE